MFKISKVFHRFYWFSPRFNAEHVTMFCGTLIKKEAH